MLHLWIHRGTTFSDAISVMPRHNLCWLMMVGAIEFGDSITKNGAICLQRCEYRPSHQKVKLGIVIKYGWKPFRTEQAYGNSMAL